MSQEWNQGPQQQPPLPAAGGAPGWPPAPTQPNYGQHAGYAAQATYPPPAYGAPGLQPVDQPVDAAAVPAVTAFRADAPLFAEPLLVVVANRTSGPNRARQANYVINDGNGRQVAAMWHAQSSAGSIQVVDMDGNVLLWVHTTYTLFTRLIVVQDAGGKEICRVHVRIPKSFFLKFRTSIEVGGLPCVSMIADSWRYRGGRTFTIHDPGGVELGRIATKGKYSGPTLEYVVQIHPSVDGPRRPLITASAIATVLLQTSGRPSAFNN